ncbi:hypothetical protein [Pseudomonas sp. TMB3-21]
MPNDTLITIITTTVVTIIATVIANQLSKSAAIEFITQLTGSIMANIARFMARFGVSLGFISWTIWTWFSFGASEKPIERIEVLELVYFSGLGFWFIQDLIRDLTRKKLTQHSPTKNPAQWPGSGN